MTAQCQFSICVVIVNSLNFVIFIVINILFVISLLFHVLVELELSFIKQLHSQKFEE